VAARDGGNARRRRRRIAVSSKGVTSVIHPNRAVLFRGPCFLTLTVETGSPIVSSDVRFLDVVPRLSAAGRMRTCSLGIVSDPVRF
jgi:hypothetical protein